MHQTDVKLGRGGDANSHIGNIKFRQLIGQYKPRYTAASRSNKPFVAEEVVQLWRGLTPPGRFLVRSDPALGDDSTWHDVGNKRARKKASQALREKDRTEDLVGLGHPLGAHHHHPHHHHHGMPHHHVLAGHTARIPGMVAATNAAASAPPLVSHPSLGLGAAGLGAGALGTPQQQQQTQATLAAAVAAITAANDQSRKRARQPESTAGTAVPDRRVAARLEETSNTIPSTPSVAIDPQTAARALQQLLQPSALTAGAPAGAAGSNDAMLLPVLQLLMQQKQQQEQQQLEQLQRQQTVAALTAAIQSLTGGAGASAATSAPGAAPAAAPTPAQALAFLNRATSTSSNTSASAAPAPGAGNNQSLDRLLAARILEGLIGGGGTGGAAGGGATRAQS